MSYTWRQNSSCWQLASGTVTFRKRRIKEHQHLNARSLINLEFRLRRVRGGCTATHLVNRSFVFSSFFFLRVYFTCLGVLPAFYVCAPHVCSDHGCQGRTSDPPELELQMVVGCHVVLGTNPGSSTRATSAKPFELLSHYDASPCVISFNRFIELSFTCHEVRPFTGITA